MVENNDDIETEDDSEDVQKERDELNKLGVSSTFNLLKEHKKDEEEEKKPEFRGFK